MGRKLPDAFGPYLLTRLLGEGGYGHAFLAQPMDPESGLPARLVIKTLRRDRATEEGFVERFKHESAVAVCLNSDHIAHVHAAGAIDDELYIAMEYVPGLPLSKVLNGLRKDKRMLSAARVVELCSGGLLALADIHRAKDPKSGAPLDIVHRDVSPKNLIVTPAERMKLIDLGIGKSVLQEWKTQTGYIVGSPGYMAPEQVAGLTIDHRIDLYAMAIVVYETLTLRTYLPRGQLMQVLTASLAPTFTPPSQLREGVGEELDRALAKGLSRDPNDRFATADELLDALREAVKSSSSDEDATKLTIQLEPETSAEIELPSVQSDVRKATVFARRTLLPATKLLPSTRPRRALRRRPSGLVPLLLAAAAMVAIAVGVSAARYADGGAPPMVVTEPGEPAEAPVVPKAEAKLPPPEPEPEPEPEPVSVPIDPPRREKPKRVPPPITAEKPPPPEPILDLETLENRALDLSKNADPSDKAEVHRLLSDIAMEQASRDGGGSRERVLRLKLRVERLEAKLR